MSYPVFPFGQWRKRRRFWKPALEKRHKPEQESDRPVLITTCINAPGLHEARTLAQIPSMSTQKSPPRTSEIPHLNLIRSFDLEWPALIVEVIKWSEILNQLQELQEKELIFYIQKCSLLLQSVWNLRHGHSPVHGCFGQICQSTTLSWLWAVFHTANLSHGLTHHIRHNCPCCPISTDLSLTNPSQRSTNAQDWLGLYWQVNSLHNHFKHVLW